MKVIEIRYFPKGESDVVYHPDTLSGQLQDALKEASRFRGYQDNSSPPSIQVEVVKVYDRYKPRPSGNNWYTVYNEILAEDSICQQIKDLDVDQVWMWVDPRPGYDANPGVESAISSPYFRSQSKYAVTPFYPFCNAESSFVFMGFDTSRTYDLALHSFGHYMEGLLEHIQSKDLYWNRFSGSDNGEYPRTAGCGNVHFPPNGTSDYDYDNTAIALTSCEDWNPDVTGQKIAYSCSRWGCTQGGYLTWWMQNMPNMNNSLTYQGKKIPNWWDFVVDFDETITRYAQQKNIYFIDQDYLDSHPNIPTPMPSQTATPVITTLAPSLIQTTFPATVAVTQTTSPKTIQTTVPVTTSVPAVTATTIITTVPTTTVVPTTIITTVAPTSATTIIPTVKPTVIKTTTPTAAVQTTTPTPIPTLTGTKLPANAPYNPNATLLPSTSIIAANPTNIPSTTPQLENTENTTPTPTLSDEESAQLPIGNIIAVVAVAAVSGGLVLGAVFFMIKKRG
jgi:hypothetical protein